MSDPFRNELEAAQEQIRRKDDKIAELEAEKVALKEQLSANRPSMLPYVFGGLALLLFFGVVISMSVMARSSVSASASPGIALTTEAPKPTSTFQRNKAAEALSEANGHLLACYTDARSINYHVSITFAPPGNVISVGFDEPSGLSPAEKECVKTQLTNKVTVPPFDGPSVRVGKTLNRTNSVNDLLESPPSR